MLRALAVIVVAISMVAGLGALPAAADTAVPPGTVNAPETVSADPLPTVQINGVVWTQTIAGPWVYAGGQFTSARPAGAALGEQETPRSNFLRYNLETGVLDAGYDLPFNGRVLDSALSPDGKTLYVVGNFTKVGTTDRFRLAALNAATGALIQAFTPGANGSVAGVAVADGAIWVTGSFTQINSSARTRVASLDAVTGNVLPFTATLAGGANPDGRSVVVSPDASKIVVSGSFTTANGATDPGRGIVALDAATGASMPWAMSTVLHNADRYSGMMGLTSDGDSVYGSGYSNGGDGFEGSFRANWSDGSLVWMEDCHGDTYDVAVAGDVVYKASHAHYCGNIGEFPQLSPWYYNHGLAFSKEPSARTITADIHGYRSYTGNIAGRLLHWYPIFTPGTYTGQAQATWTVTAGSGYVLYGGEFPKAGGVAQQGIVRFAAKDTAPNTAGPVITGGAFAITATSVRANQARVSFVANHDPDNAELRYELYRKGVATPIATTTAQSTYWVRPSLTLTDDTATTGQTYEYRVRVVDAFGNATVSNWASVTIDNGTANAYNLSVLDSVPRAYWPLTEASGTKAYDWVASNDLTLTNATRAVAGPLTGTSTATRFSGSATSLGATATAAPATDDLTVEAWFQTTSTSGGRIVGFGNAKSGNSSTSDRHIYLSGDGTLRFGVLFNGEKRTIASANGYNDGAWHHVVGTLSKTGMTFTVDGVQMGQDLETVAGAPGTGYWRIGSDSLSGWPSAGSASLSGSIAEVAVYDRALSATEIAAHWAAAGRMPVQIAAPTDAYGAAVFARSPLLYWRLGEASGTKAADAGPASLPGRYQYAGTAVRYGVAGPVVGGGTGVELRPSKNFFGIWSTYQSIVGSREMLAPTTYAAEGWFKSTSTAGGRIFGFGNSANNAISPSTTTDRLVSMTTSGAISFGIYDGAKQVLTSPEAYNDGQWHHVIAQQIRTGTDAGMQLYVDGELVASNAVVTGDRYTGYWRVGADAGWEGAAAWSGSIAEFAVYGSTFGPTEAAEQYELGSTGAIDRPPTALFTSASDGLALAVDASGSSDAEGPIASYAWSFGDGGTAMGATASHTYAAAGTYDVALTVTDGAGKSHTLSQQVQVLEKNVVPIAAFEHAAAELTLSVDASGSTDADGTIQTYAWDFGDGGTGAGATAEHTFAESGTYTVTLTVTDDRGDASQVSHDVTVTAPTPNVPPVAAFTASNDRRVASFDGSTSTDPDGTIAEYAWTFGDGATGMGATATHTYAEPGTYAVTLTVTDDRGATAQADGSVTVGAGPGVIAEDTFERTAASGWGTAETGGAWTLSGGTSAFAVADGAGTITLAPSQTRQATLAAVSAANSVSQVTFRTDTVSAGGVASLQINGRTVGSSVYAARVRLEAGGVLRLYLLQGETALGGASFVLPDGYVAGEDYTVGLSVLGTGPTRLGAKVWRTADAEPAAWQLQATDTTAALQAAGTVGLKASVSSLSTVSKTVLSVRDYVVSDGSTGGDVNLLPVAAFQATPDGLSVALDAAESRDDDGTIVTYTWSVDGQTATGQTASITLPRAGTYAVTLTVTDDDGAVATVTREVTVSAPLEAGEVAKDTFDRTASSAWGTADAGGAWTLSGGASAFSVADGRGLLTLAPSWTRLAELRAVSETDTTLSATFSSAQAAAGSGAVSFTAAGRVVSGSAYQARVRFEAGGTVRAYIMRDETALGGTSLVLPGTYETGTDLTLKLQVTGTSPTTVSAKLWKTGTEEPAAWQLTATDSTAALQSAGSVSLRGTVSAGITTAQPRLSIDSLLVVTP